MRKTSRASEVPGAEKSQANRQPDLDLLGDVVLRADQEFQTGVRGAKCLRGKNRGCKRELWPHGQAQRGQLVAGGQTQLDL